MMTRLLRIVSTVLTAALVGTGGVRGATSFSDSLTGFTGDSTQAATQTAVAAAGFSFFSVDGLDPLFTMDPTVVFDASGASFGTLWAGDGGRNYMRTNDTDYVTVDFTAEITVTVDEVNSDQTFFGLGAGDTALFGVPDWSTQFSSTFVTAETGFLKTWSSSNDVNVWNDNDPVPELAGTGTHRLQMVFDSTAKTMTYAIDLNYSSGAFVADYQAPPLSLDVINCPSGCGGGTTANFFGPDGWPGEPSRIYFGGDDGAVFRDFSVTVNSTTASCDFDGQNGCNIDDLDALVDNIANGPANPAVYDLTGDGQVTRADINDPTNGWLRLAGEENLGPGRTYREGDANLSTLVDGSDFGIWNANKFNSVAAWSAGDFNADGSVDGSDFGIWNTNKFTSASSAVPEPGYAVLLVACWLAARPIGAGRRFPAFPQSRHESASS